jgi:hypothetical protein
MLLLELISQLLLLLLLLLWHVHTAVRCGVLAEKARGSFFTLSCI